MAITLILTNIWLICAADSTNNFQLDSNNIRVVGVGDTRAVSIYYALEMADEFIRKEVPSINLATCERNTSILLSNHQVQIAYTQGLGKDLCSVYLVPDGKSFRIVKTYKGKGKEGRPPKGSSAEELIKANEKYKRERERRNR